MSNTKNKELFNSNCYQRVIYLFSNTSLSDTGCEVDGTGSVSCLIAGFTPRGFELFGSAKRGLGTWKSGC